MPSPFGTKGLVITEAEPLKPYTTFKIGGPARYFARATSREEFRAVSDLAAQLSLPLFVLGGGSNILVSDAGFNGVVVHPVCRGIAVLHEDPEGVTLEVNSGEAWDDVVQHAVKHNWWRIENLSHIPGQAGAALVQNIGAYGQQVSDVVQSARVMDIATGAPGVLTAAECGFSYRRSIFNSTARGKLIIVGLTLHLTKHGRPQLDYPDVRTYFQEHGIQQPSLTEIRQAIITIRDRKFPFPREERGGNAGSFFKNLPLREAEYAALHETLRRNFSPHELTRLEEIRNRFPAQDRIKIPTAFLIEICGLKGYRIGGAQVNETQPLVLINQGGATAQDVIALARHVRKTVRARIGVTIAIEPELIGFTKQELAEIENQ
ncbi:MAG TPA: UDP-N-acetylmuramate dehydrogenase [Terriglobia bacterium]|nr:UDP-N-acetylmuramate dehydrogenase [Terriglobia bacterium]